MRACVGSTDLYAYPDLVAFCGEPRLQDRELDILFNPQVIIEVLCPSTEADDGGSKFAHYRRLESLRDYVHVAQDRICVERYTRQAERDAWLLTELSRLEDVLHPESIPYAIPLSELYAKVQLGAEAEV